MAARFVSFEELVGRIAPGLEPACTAPFGGLGRPRGRRVPGMPVPGLDRSTPVEEVFACFEAHGLRPFPDVEGWDRQTAIDRLEACLAVPRDLVADVEPDPRIGINNPALHFDDYDLQNPEGRDTQKYNFPPNVMFDLARIGVGTLRHIQGPDLAWFHLIGNDVPISPPEKMRSILPDSNWSAFGGFTCAVITCLYTGQRLIPLIFGAGGGSSTSPPKIAFGKPSFQRRAYVPVDAGWDPWYWKLATGAIGSQGQLFQRFALNLIPQEGLFAAYHLECCYRKCLGLLTFADMVGEYLARLAAAIDDCTEGAATLTDIVPAIECGNEMDTFYDLSDPTTRRAAAREFGRYHALLAGPIIAQGLGLRARLGETFFWYQQRSDWDRTVLWLRETITVGVVEEVDRWHEVATVPAADPLWTRLAREAGWTWWTTPGASRAGDLVHEVGFHSFTWTLWGTPSASRSTYRPETAFVEEAAELVAEVAQHGEVRAVLGHGLEWSCCVGFQGSRPSDPITTGPEWHQDDHFGGNTLPHQGGMVARRMLAAFAMQTPPTFVTWYASMGGLTRGDRIWDLYSSSGLRNVLYEGSIAAAAEPTGPLPHDQAGFFYQSHAWPRPAWHTLRRLAWLLARSNRVEVVYQNEVSGAMAVRLVSGGDFHDPLVPAAPRTWRYAYVAWLDGSKAAAAGVAYWQLDLGPLWLLPKDPLDSCEQLPLVPAVSGVSGTPSRDYGFAQTDSADWNATPQTSLVTRGSAYTTDPFSAYEYFAIKVMPSDPTSNPAPICVLCDLEVQGLSVVPSVLSVPDGTFPASKRSEVNAGRSAGEDSTTAQNAMEKRG